MARRIDTADDDRTWRRRVFRVPEKSNPISRSLSRIGAVGLAENSQAFSVTNQARARAQTPAWKKKRRKKIPSARSCVTGLENGNWKSSRKKTWRPIEFLLWENGLRIRIFLKHSILGGLIWKHVKFWSRNNYIVRYDFLKENTALIIFPYFPVVFPFSERRKLITRWIYAMKDNRLIDRICTFFSL